MPLLAAALCQGGDGVAGGGAGPRRPEGTGRSRRRAPAQCLGHGRHLAAWGAQPQEAHRLAWARWCGPRRHTWSEHVVCCSPHHTHSSGHGAPPVAEAPNGRHSLADAPLRVHAIISCTSHTLASSKKKAADPRPRLPRGRLQHLRELPLARGISIRAVIRYSIIQSRWGTR